MTALTLMITRAGQARFTAAQLDADINLGIAAIGLTDAPFVSAPTLTVLPGEFKRLTSISGDQVGDNIVHLAIRDDSADTFYARGFGLFLADGTLFATYAQPTRIFEKSARATFLAAIDIAFPTGDVSELRFGNTDFLNPPATTERKGVVELATVAEGVAGTDPLRAPPVLVVKAMITTALNAAIAPVAKSVTDLATSIGQALDGLAARTVFGSGLVKGGGRNDVNRTLTVDAATADQVRAGIAGDVAITPAGLAALAAAFAATGEFMLAPGIHAKLGTATDTFVEGPTRINFATPFPSACKGVWITSINATGSSLRDIYMQRQSMDPAGFTAFVQKAGSDGTSIDGFDWIAIGH